MFGISSFAQAPFASLAGNTYNLQTNESFNLYSETYTANVAFLGTASESFTLSDSDSPVFNFYVTSSDNFSLSDEARGAWYTLERYANVEFDLSMWLCDVTKYVFGDFPKQIYFK